MFLQDRLKAELVETDELVLSEVTQVGGVDISFVKESTTKAAASLVVLAVPRMEVLYERTELVHLTQPYVPGFLAFREVPFLSKLVDDLRQSQPELMPHVIMVDGNGVLHPRGFGVACHLGVVTGTPCVGVGKSLFHMDGISKKSVKEVAARELKHGGDHSVLVGTSGREWGAAVRAFWSY